MGATSQAMTAALAVGQRVLPRGYRDLGRQLAIWLGFLLAYQVARGMADREGAAPAANAWKVMDVERRFGTLWELSLQGLLESSRVLVWATSWTYWLSQFTVMFVTLFWVYLRRNELFLRFRNSIIVANLIGLVGYVLLPTAPPRMFPGLGFVDVLERFGIVKHSSAIIELASNPYAAMPSLHAADALLVGVTMAFAVRRRIFKAVWIAWPVWVWFCVIATGNHFWLDVVAGVAVAALAAVLVYRRPLRAKVARLA